MGGASGVMPARATLPVRPKGDERTGPRSPEATPNRDPEATPTATRKLGPEPPSRGRRVRRYPWGGASPPPPEPTGGNCPCSGVDRGPGGATQIQPPSLLLVEGGVTAGRKQLDD